VIKDRYLMFGGDPAQRVIAKHGDDDKTRGSSALPSPRSTLASSQHMRQRLAVLRLLMIRNPVFLSVSEASN